MKKIISFVISAVIILSGLTFAFADDPEEEPASSSGASASYEEQLKSLSVQLAASTTYTADDIYNLLNQCTVSYLNQLCLRVFDPGTINALNTQGTSINSYLQSIDNFISSWYNNYLVFNDGSSNYSSVQLLYNLSVALDQINSNTSSSFSSDPSLYDLVSNMLQNTIIGLISDNANHDPYLYLINQDTTNIKNHLVYNNTSVAQHLYNVTSAISTTNNILTNVKTDTASIANNTRNLVSDLSSSGPIASSIISLQYDFNNINWLDNSNLSFLGASTSLVNALNGTYQTGVIDSPYLVFKVNNTSPNTSNYVYNINLNLFSTNIYSDGKFSFYQGSNGHINKVLDSFYFTRYSGNLIFSINDIYTANLIIKCPSGYRLSNQNLNIKYLNNNSLDYHYVMQLLYSEHDRQILDTFKELYASDDLINAKKNQQVYEDQVINDFTGSGSAAAKASDASSAKDISSAVSSGLNSGGSVNNSLNVFNPSGGFWGWFSQENSDLINTLSSQNRLRSSGSGSDWVIDDPYQRNAEELQSILGGDR